MYRAYVDGRLTMDEVGRAYGIGGERVSELFKREGLPAITHAERGASLTVPERVERGDRIAAGSPRYGREYLAECVAMAAAEDGTESLSLKRYQELAREWGLPSGARVTQVFGSWRAAKGGGAAPEPAGPRELQAGVHLRGRPRRRPGLRRRARPRAERQAVRRVAEAGAAGQRQGLQGAAPVGDAGPQPVAAQALGPGDGRRVRSAARIGSVPTLRRKGAHQIRGRASTATWRESARRPSAGRHRGVPLPARAAARQRGRPGEKGWLEEQLKAADARAIGTPK
jgi:hypothetical protein